MKITCCSELWKWSPKTTDSGGAHAFLIIIIRKACAPREPWKIRKKRSYDSENRRIFQLVRDLQSLKKRQNSCYRRHLRAHAFFNNYQKSMCPQKTLKCTLKTKITCCSELWKWSPKTTDSGGAHAFLIWEMPATDPSRKCRFRRSLPQLGTACNLRFSACIHTSAFIKETLIKLDWIRSQLYEQLRRRPKQHFSQNYILYTIRTLKLTPGCKNQRKRRSQKISKISPHNIESTLYSIPTPF